MKSNELQEIIGGQRKVFNYRKNKRPNQFRITRSYFYRHGGSEDALEASIKKILDDKRIKYVIIDKGNNWHSFVGGAKPGSSQDSFWYVVIEIMGEANNAI